MPRATNSAFVSRRRTLSRTELSTNSDKVSPLASTPSTCSRSSGSTRIDGMVADFIRLNVSHLRCKINDPACGVTQPDKALMSVRAGLPAALNHLATVREVFTEARIAPPLGS